MRRCFPSIDFNPRSPHGERQYNRQQSANSTQFQPTLPARGATCLQGLRNRFRVISTHAPRTGSDVCPARQRHRPRYFNPRSPHGERRRDDFHQLRYSHDFNPRSPHGERRRPAEKPGSACDISTHAPRTGSDVIPHITRIAALISTHAPRTGSDIPLFTPTPYRFYFNPRSPHGERPKADRRMRQERKISTHAPRTGSDRRVHSKAI